MFENKEASGRIGKWATKLAEHTIDFVPRIAIKSQVLAEFNADWTPALPSQETPKLESIWQLECDGGIPEKWGRGFGNPHYPIGHTIEICNEATLQKVHKQCCRI